MSTLAHSLSAAKTPAFALVTEGWNELVQEGLTPDGLGVTSFDGSAEVLYILDNDQEPVAALVYSVDSRLRTIELHMAYVEHSSRRRGYFRALALELVKLAKGRGYQEIAVTLPTDSSPEANGARAAFRRVLSLTGGDGRHIFRVP